jgi:hypothetical protein
MRPIDADALMKDVSFRCNREIVKYKTMRHALGNVWRAAFDAVKAAPTIDVEPVVRCKDCKHWGTGYGGETDSIKVCEYANYMVGRNGFCVYGERKMDLEVQHD